MCVVQTVESVMHSIRCCEARGTSRRSIRRALRHAFPRPSSARSRRSLLQLRCSRPCFLSPRDKLRPGRLAMRLLGNGDHTYVKGGDGAGGERGVAQEVTLLDAFDGDECLVRRMRHCHQLTLQTDPDIAVCIRLQGVKQRDIRFDGWEDHDRIAGAVLRQGIIDRPPVRPHAREVRADDAAQRHERHALFGGLQAGVNGGAGGNPSS